MSIFLNCLIGKASKNSFPKKIIGPFFKFFKLLIHETLFDNTLFFWTLIRFALFIGKFKLLDGVEFDKLQESIVSKNWTSEFNSLLITDIDFDNKKLSVDPEYIIKRFEQQTPLSYHEIDKKTLTPTWDHSYTEYNII